MCPKLITSQSLAIHSTSAPQEVETPTIYTGLIAQSRFHIKTNQLHHRLLSRPEPSLQDILSLQAEVDEWENSLPLYFRPNSPLIQSHQAYMFARYRLSWRVWNLKIVLLRPVLLRWSARQKSGDDQAPESDEEVTCRQDCLQHARETITSISDFMSRDIGTRLSTWYIL